MFDWKRIDEEVEQRFAQIDADFDAFCKRLDEIFDEGQPYEDSAKEVGKNSGGLSAGNMIISY